MYMQTWREVDQQTERCTLQCLTIQASCLQNIEEEEEETEKIEVIDSEA